MMKFLILSLFLICALGFETSWGWSVSVKGDRLNYNIDFTKKTFDYKDAYIQKNWPVKSCNKRVFEKVITDFHKSFKMRLELKGKFPNQLTYKEDKKSYQIAQNSPFGIFLTQFPNRIIYLMTEEEQACKTHRK